MHLRSTPRRACRSLAALALSAVALAPAVAQSDTDSAPPALDRVTVTGDRPTTLPLEIPTTLEAITAERIGRAINATDAEDALKYFPSLLVRRRYIGDYDHAVLATRASGTGNSARSLVYADGVLLSNLLGNGAGFTPRWGLVMPEEIERVDVLYGPFSAAYPGNSAGAIVDFVTRMPTALEAHVKLQAFGQRFKLDGDDSRYGGGQGSASIGSRDGAFAWWLSLDRQDSEAQPIVFANRLVSAGTPGNAGTPVTGAVAGQDPRQRDWLLLGATGQTHTVQDHAKLKLAYDLTPSLRASYVLGWWRNDADRAAQSDLRDASGATVTSGSVQIAGRAYALLPTDFARSAADQQHLTHGLGLKSNTGGHWDWEAIASLYDMARDRVRTEATAVSRADPVTGRSVTTYPPTLTDMHGTGWTTLALRGIWRPDGMAGPHTVEFGVQRDAFALRQTVSELADFDTAAPTGRRVSAFTGNTALTSLWAQDTWRFAPGWRSVLGLRAERWRATDGSVAGSNVDAQGTPAPPIALGERSEFHLSPKAALSWRASDAWTFKASLGRAVRMPTVSELYQGSVAGDTVVNNDPQLKPETSWTGELSAERQLDGGVLRATLFTERTHDALYAQTDVTVTPNVTNIQNVDQIHTTGLELAGDVDDLAQALLGRGLDVQASLTYADSTIGANTRFPASIGKRQPRVPLWRGSLLASYRIDARWSASIGSRFSGRQYGQLDNSDTNAFAYTGFSSFWVTDLRLQARLDRHWTASLGVDNVNQQTYWAFHPYPQRTWHAELKWEL